MTMKQITTKEKITQNKPVTDGRAAMLFKDLLRPVLNLLAGFRIPYQVMIEQPCRLLPDRPVIYAANHSCFADGPIMGCVTSKRSYILCGRQRMGFSDWLYFMLNGVIFVDRKDREDRAACKVALEVYLNGGRSVVMFPEGTWNLTENLLMLPMKWGIIEIARATGAQIIPTVLSYDRARKRCSVRFGKAMVIAPEDERLEAVTALRDALATLRWEAMGREPVLDREYGPEAWRKENELRLSEWPSLDWAYECSCIFRPDPVPEEAFACLDRLQPCRENAFLLRRR